jgi:hypothetical protein
MSVWGIKKSEQYRKANREYQRRWRRENPHAARQYCRNWNNAHKEQIAANNKKQKDRVRALIEDFKRRPCADCGQSHLPFVMDFDHVRGRKCFQIAGHAHYALARILKEISKCDIVCSNCHRYRTFASKGTNGA